MGVVAVINGGEDECVVAAMVLLMVENSLDSNTTYKE